MAGRFGSKDEAKRRAEESLRSIEAGGLPLAARERLAEVRRRGDGFFTSTFSVPEFLVARQAGFRPLTQVMGSCFYRLGWQASSSYGVQGGGWTAEGRTVELAPQTEAWNDARALALGRLREEARLAGADAVVGVSLARGSYEWGSGLIELVATGTAVRSERFDLGGEPVLSNLTGQEFGALFAHGHWPADIVAATSVCLVQPGQSQRNRSQGFLSRLDNQELPDYTRGVYYARSRMLGRVEQQGREAGAHGLLGVTVRAGIGEVEVNRQECLLVTLHVLGTAVVELAGHERPPVSIALSLD